MVRRTKRVGRWRDVKWAEKRVGLPQRYVGTEMTDNVCGKVRYKRYMTCSIVFSRECTEKKAW